ncbi:MAG: laccase domain-containing protein, partial [Hyphomicrobiaceae bacterium]
MADSLQARGLSRLSGIRHGFFTRRGGVSGGVYAELNCGLGSRDDPAAVRENRTRVARTLGVEPGSLVTLYQVHGTTVVTLDRP